MRRRTILALTAGLALMSVTGAFAQAAIPGYIAAAVADAGRPAGDKARDAGRKPAEMMVIANVKPGQKIGEMLVGSGYFTRVFSKAVGPSGKVYILGMAGRAAGLATDPQYGNINIVTDPITSFKAPEPLDLIWTSRNYHDMAPAQRADMNKAAFGALKSGGIYIVLDHAAKRGAGEAIHRQLHRADENIVRAELESAGFALVESNNTLRNPADNVEGRVMDNEIRDSTDQFILKYRKP